MTKPFQGRLPILLSIGFVVTLIGLGSRKLLDPEWSGTPGLLGAAFLLSYLAWLAIESRVAAQEVRKSQTSLDRGTLELYAFGRFSTVASALALPAPPGPLGVLAFGFALFVVGVSLRLAAIRTLGQFYSHRVRVVESHRIVDAGPYRHLRHPAYTGMLLAHCGLVLVFFHWVSAALLLLVFAPAVVLRIRVEEAVLMKLSGYPEYSLSRPRLLPFVW